MAESTEVRTVDGRYYEVIQLGYYSLISVTQVGRFW